MLIDLLGLEKNVSRNCSRGVTLFLVIFLCACQQESMDEKGSQPIPPIAKKVARDVSIHGDRRIDNYYWIRDDTRTDAAVIAHLEAENAYTKKVMQASEGFQEKLYQELVGRLEQEEDSVPFKYHDYWYYSRYSTGMEFKRYFRRPQTMQAPEEPLLDLNKMAAGQAYFSLGALAVSPNSQIMAFATDTLGRRIYTIEFKDLNTGRMLTDKLEGVANELVWSNDNKTLYYIGKDKQTLLEYQVFRHTLGTPQSEDILVFEEQDHTYYTGITKSLDESKILISHTHTLQTGVSLIDANNPDADVHIFHPIRNNHEYTIKKSGDYFYVRTNWNAPNFRIMRVRENDAKDRSLWQEVVAHDANTYISDFLVLQDFLILNNMRNAVIEMRIIPLEEKNQGKADYFLDFAEQAFSASFETNVDSTAKTLRINYSSLTTPESVYEYDLVGKSRRLLKQRVIPGGFVSANYASERIFVAARDGAQVPVTIVYRKDRFKKDGTNPLYQYGYGSYGANVTPYFRADILPLLDRGFVYAISHIRGSQAMGVDWYKDGKLFNKLNTFTDYIDVTKELVRLGYGDSQRVFAEGRSAGGLLMGAVLNMAPELYRGMIAGVPFVDVLTTMLDESIPLTSNEWDEWGDPRDPDYYAYMKGYSPYDNVERKAYPALLVTSGFHDSQVQYFEPAKWVAKLREMKTDDNLLIFDVDMASGHGGASGRFKPYERKALEYAFILGLTDIHE